MYHFLRSIIVALLMSTPMTSVAQPAFWQNEWPNTDFSQTNIDFSEIISGGPPKDGIPAIDHPKFSDQTHPHGLDPKEPVLALARDGVAKAYPLRILIWHEIVNDTIGSTPITVTYCPLCNSAIVFDRRFKGKILDFGVSGKLRHSDMLMYDRQTESWWQQFLGEGIVGEMTGGILTQLPSRLLAYQQFIQTYPDGQILLPPTGAQRPYGRNPYEKYDSAQRPFLYRGTYNGPGVALSYVVAVGKQAWLLQDLRNVGEIIQGDLRLRWTAGMRSALDHGNLSKGRTIGSVQVQQKKGTIYQDIPHDLTFAFAFQAFHPKGVIHSSDHP